MSARPRVRVAPASRFLSEEECHALIQRVRGFARGGGETTVRVESAWLGNLRWARNQIISSGDTRDNVRMYIQRNIDGAIDVADTNQIDDRHLVATVRRAERGAAMRAQVAAADRDDPPFREPFPRPPIWSEATYNQTAEARAELAVTLTESARAAGMLSAGYIQVGALGKSIMDSISQWYYPFTLAQYSVTVRDPQGTGSGWAGQSGMHWEKIDAAKLSEVALDKCLRSRNPVRVEPGRYTTILEPQAVGDLTDVLFGGRGLSREWAEYGDPNTRATDPFYKENMTSMSPFGLGGGHSMLGRKVIDERLTVRIDNMDPDLGFPPFEGWQVYHPVTWIKDGVLQELAYNHEYAVQRLGRNTGGVPQYGLMYHGAHHMSSRGETTSLDDMIATTKRGIYVTRFSDLTLPPLDEKTMLLSGYTRDGTWLIENGKITKPVMNFRFTDSPLFMLNKVEQIGVPRKTFSPNLLTLGLPEIPIVVPALKVSEFNFTGLSDAV